MGSTRRRNSVWAKTAGGILLASIYALEKALVENLASTCVVLVRYRVKKLKVN